MCSANARVYFFLNMFASEAKIEKSITKTIITDFLEAWKPKKSLQLKFQLCCQNQNWSKYIQSFFCHGTAILE